MTILSMAFGRLLHYYRHAKEEPETFNEASYEEQYNYELEKIYNERTRYIAF